MKYNLNNENLKNIGNGRTRKVYELLDNDNVVLKQLTYNPLQLGIEDVNKIEYDLYNTNKDTYKFLSKVYEYDIENNNLIMEKIDCKYIENLTKKCPLIRTKYHNNLLDFLSGEQEELFNQLVDFNIEDVSKFCCENDLMYDEINLSQQWGIDKSGHLRLIDYNR